MSTYERIISNTSYPVNDHFTRIHTIDMHTGGEPLRVVISGYPLIEGNTILEKRRWLKTHSDDIRKALMREPRGHADMYGCLLTAPDLSDSDFGIIFMHNEGYSSMCGHATIAITKLALEMGWVDKTGPLTKLKIDAPCGQLEAYGEIIDGKVKRCKFRCVPSFVVALNLKVNLPAKGSISYDIAYGGAFYAYVDIDQFDMELTPEYSQELIQLGMDIKEQVMLEESGKIRHPYEPDLSFLYGTIFTGKAKNPANHSRNVCVFADGQIDRSPTGSGVSGRLAIHYKKKEIKLEETVTIESIIGTEFSGAVEREETFGSYNAIIPEVGGEAFVTGENILIIDPEDPLGKGFLLR